MRLPVFVGTPVIVESDESGEKLGGKIFDIAHSVGCIEKDAEGKDFGKYHFRITVPMTVDEGERPMNVLTGLLVETDLASCGHGKWKKEKIRKEPFRRECFV